MFLNFGLVTKIGDGYDLIRLILVDVVLVTLWQVSRTTETSDWIVNLHFPTAQSLLTMSNGIDHSPEHCEAG